MRAGPAPRQCLRCVVLSVVLALAACSTATQASTPLGDHGPNRPAAGGDPLIVDTDRLAAPVVVDPMPAGFSVLQSRYNPPDSGYPPSRATLYGDPALADTLDGPVLLVGSSSGSAVMGGPPRGTPGERRLDLGGKEGWLVHVGDRTWVGVDPDGQDYVEFVVARGVRDEDVIRAAETADFGADTATVAVDAVPPGLQPLIAGSPRDGPYSGIGEFIRFDSDSATVYVSAVRADPRLAALWGFWADDPSGTLVRGQPGSVGTMDGIGLGQDARGHVWAEGGMVLSVIAYGGDEELLDQVVGSLRVGTTAEFEAMRLGPVTQEPSAEDAGCPPGTPLVSAREGDLRWVFGLGAIPGYPDAGLSSCMALISTELFPNSGSGSFELRPLGQVSGSTFGFGGVAPAPEGTIVGGVAPPGTARVSITGPGAVTRDAVLLPDGPRPGERIFGQFFPGSQPAGDRFVVTAFDGTGAAIGTLTL